METAKFITALVLGLFLIAGFFFGKSRVDKLSSLLICFLGCAAVLWAILGFRRLGSEADAAFFHSLGNFVGGIFVGLAVALFTSLWLAKAERPSQHPK